MPELNGWTNFYVIVGSAAGALIGLQFVVMTLIANLPISRGNAQAGDAFSTPTVAHIAVVHSQRLGHHQVRCLHEDTHRSGN